ncbi:hypothetical protein [Nonomuraea sp. NPDC049725]|uniref:hypothetical protein n=1 Tax=Nonomuraea sp. NPDC049725 TaxID=3154508 RepID=UPI003432306E
MYELPLQGPRSRPHVRGDFHVSLVGAVTDVLTAAGYQVFPDPGDERATGVVARLNPAT